MLARLLVRSTIALTLLGCVGDEPAATSTPVVDAGEAPGEKDAEPAPAPPSDDGGGPTPGGPLELDIHVLRNPNAAGHPTYGTKVKVKGLVVSGAKTAGSTHGFFAQHESNVVWGGIFVFVGSAPVSVAPGDKINVTGEYATYQGQDQIHATLDDIERTASALTVTAVNVALTDINNGGGRALELQSVYLSVKNVEVLSAPPGLNFRVRPIAGGSDELVITSYVANDIDPSPFTPQVGNRFSTIRGFGYRVGPTEVAMVNKLAPLGAADLEAE
ncbi:MAG: hypothetical protein KF795_12635 [Labilithrix sp.]|nr:hypothetical protein [Labilithrix sp.]